jgi:trehalose synthase-fused probable maltokinase
MASKPPRSELLAVWLPQQRWFGAKGRRIIGIDVEDTVALEDAALHVLRVHLDDGGDQRYAVPLSPGVAPVDALDDARFARSLLRLARERARVAGGAGALIGHRSRAFPDSLGDAPSVRRLGGEQSNTSVVLGDALILKHFRRLPSGVNPDLEITRFLTDTARFPHTPALAGWLEYADAKGDLATLAMMQTFVPDARDGWEWMLAALQDDRRRAATPPALRRLGEATAALHLTLARAPASEPALAAQPTTDADLADWITSIATLLATARAAAPSGASVPAVAPSHLLAALAALRARAKCRCHGDFHLGQTLYRETTDAWTIIDFEGEPLRPLAERRQKHSPLRDVAGMLRSVAYAAETTRATAPGAWIDEWERAARAAFLEGYFMTAEGAPFLPAETPAALRAIAAFEVEKAAYEVAYEANHRPEWIAIPLRGLARATSALAPPATSGAA